MFCQINASRETALQFAFSVASHGDPQPNGAMLGNDSAIKEQIELDNPLVRVSVSELLGDTYRLGDPRSQGPRFGLELAGCRFARGTGAGRCRDCGSAEEFMVRRRDRLDASHNRLKGEPV